MLLNRRRWLGWQTRWPVALALATVAGGIGACAAGQGGIEGSQHDTDLIRDAATGRRLGVEEVKRRMRSADIVLLGEIHDNPHHHQRRAALLTGLGRPVPVVLEHLPRGAALALPRDVETNDALRQALEGAGFDVRGWRWPLHRPLFVAIARAGHGLLGGNLTREATRRVAREGLGALPSDLGSLVDATPLSVAGQQALEQDLQDGHCGQLGARHLPGMVAAQRGRDAAMAAALIAGLDRWRSEKRSEGPAVLLAGNGHVRRDYGVPQLLAGKHSGLRVLSIEFAEHAPASAARDAPVDIVWSTPKAVREDPCAGFTAPALPAR